MKIYFHGATGDVTSSAAELLRSKHGIKAALPNLGDVLEI